MQIKPAQLDGFLRKPTAKIVLVYGPDQGRVREISLHLLKAHEGNVVTLDGGDARDMIEAATARSLFGGEVAVRLREPGQKAVEALKAVLALSDSNPVVVEAGELATSSALRKLFEPHPTAVTAPVYDDPPGEEEVSRWLAEAGLRQVPQAAMRDMMALARALASDPHVLLLDEPFGKLDAALRGRFRAWVFDHARRRGLPTLLVTHDPADAEEADGPVVDLGAAEPDTPTTRISEYVVKRA